MTGLRHRDLANGIEPRDDLILPVYPQYLRIAVDVPTEYTFDQGRVAYVVANLTSQFVR